MGATNILKSTLLRSIIIEMPIDEMKIFFHQTMCSMADTFQKATGEEAISEALRDYCAHFAEKMNILAS